MRMLLGALALAASIVHTGTRAGQVETLYMSPPHQPIAAFAQDGSLVAWFAPGTTPSCNEVWLWQLGGAQERLPAQGPTNRNVTCGWHVPAGAPVGLAVADNGGSPALLWTLHESATQSLRFDYVLGATVSDRTERRFQQLAHGTHGPGLWLTGVAGSGSTLVYAAAQVAYKDQVDCLTSPNTPGACDLEVVGGGVYRVVGRKLPQPIKNVPPSVEVAASGNDVAFVPATGSSPTDGHPFAAPNASIEVRTVDMGTFVASVSTDAAPEAIALSSSMVAVLGRVGDKLVISWYSLPDGGPLGNVSVPATTAPEISASEDAIVFRVGHSIRIVDVKTQKVRTVATATSAPIGLSIAGTRIAWAENVAGRGRIRAITLAPQ